MGAKQVSDCQHDSHFLRHEKYHGKMPFKRLQTCRISYIDAAQAHKLAQSNKIAFHVSFLAQPVDRLLQLTRCTYGLIPL